LAGSVLAAIQPGSKYSTVVFAFAGAAARLAWVTGRVATVRFPLKS